MILIWCSNKWKIALCWKKIEFHSMMFVGIFLFIILMLNNVKVKHQYLVFFIIFVTVLFILRNIFFFRIYDLNLMPCTGKKLNSIPSCVLNISISFKNCHEEQLFSMLQKSCVVITNQFQFDYTSEKDYNNKNNMSIAL